MVGDDATGTRARQFINEAIRHSPSTHFLRRTTTAEVWIGGVRIPAKARVVALIAGATRDNDIFPNAHVFDVDRANANAALTFGNGPHVCVGQPVAREILVAALSTFARRSSRFTLARHRSTKVYANNVAGYACLPATVEWTPDDQTSRAIGAGRATPERVGRPQ